MRNVLKSKKGFGILEVLVASTIMSVIGLVFVSMIQNSQRAVNTSKATLNETLLKQRIHSLLSDPERCKITLETDVLFTPGQEGGRNPASMLYANPNNEHVVFNLRLNADTPSEISRNSTIDGFRIQSMRLGGAGTQSVDLADGRKRIETFFNIRVDPPKGSLRESIVDTENPENSIDNSKLIQLRMIANYSDTGTLEDCTANLMGGASTLDPEIIEKLCNLDKVSLMIGMPQNGFCDPVYVESDFLVNFNASLVTMSNYSTVPFLETITSTSMEYEYTLPVEDNVFYSELTITLIGGGGAGRSGGGGILFNYTFGEGGAAGEAKIDKVVLKPGTVCRLSLGKGGEPAAGENFDKGDFNYGGDGNPTSVKCVFLGQTVYYSVALGGKGGKNFFYNTDGSLPERGGAGGKVLPCLFNELCGPSAGSGGLPGISGEDGPYAGFGGGGGGRTHSEGWGAGYIYGKGGKGAAGYVRIQGKKFSR